MGDDPGQEGPGEPCRLQDLCGDEPLPRGAPVHPRPQRRGGRRRDPDDCRVRRGEGAVLYSPPGRQDFRGSEPFLPSLYNSILVPWKLVPGTALKHTALLQFWPSFISSESFSLKSSFIFQI